MRSMLARSLGIASLLILATAAHSQQPVSVVPAGTSVQVRLTQELRSGRCKKGDPVAGEVAADVKSADGKRVLIPAGTPVTGSVLESKRAGAFGRPGRLKLRCEAIRLPDGTTVPLDDGPSLSQTGRDRQAIATGTGVAAGAGAALGVYAATFDIFGGGPDTGGSAAAGVGAFALFSALQRGQNATAKAGYRFTVSVARETPLPQPKE